MLFLGRRNREGRCIEVLGIGTRCSGHLGVGLKVVAEGAEGNQDTLRVVVEVGIRRGMGCTRAEEEDEDPQVVVVRRGMLEVDLEEVGGNVRLSGNMREVVGIPEDPERTKQHVSDPIKVDKK